MTTKYTQTGNCYGTGNPTTNAANIRAVLTGNLSTNGRPEYSLVEMVDGSTLAASSYSPLADASQLLRARGEAAGLNVTVYTARNDGVYVPGHSGLVSYGFASLGPNAAV